MQFNEVRIFFTKTGMAKYISHLDLMRCMTRALRRAQIPLWYTEGYNPHLFMTFARPLPLGVESLCESMDIRLVGEMTFREMKTRLSDALPRDITVVSVEKPVHKPTEIAFADYEMQLYTDAPAALLQAMETRFAADTLPVRKNAKQGKRRVEKEPDIKSNLLTLDLAPQDDGVTLTARVTAGDQNNVSPALLLDALAENAPVAVKHTDILKCRVLLANGEAVC